MFKWVIPSIEVIVRRSIVLFKARVFVSSSLAALQHPSEIKLRENSIVRNNVILPMRFIIKIVLETSCIRVAQ